MSNLLYFFKLNYKQLISFFSIDYLMVFLPLVLIIFTISPKKLKKYVLLFASYFFYTLISKRYVLVILFTTILIYFVGLGIEKIYNKKELALGKVDKKEKKSLKALYNNKAKKVLIFGLVILLLSLHTFKYTKFFFSNLNFLFAKFNFDINLKAPNLLMPIGISFFTLQAISYITDVYRSTIKAEHNFPKLALYLSFFPQIIEGPICRYNQTADKLWNVESIKIKNLKLGSLRILFGLMKKLVVADRLNKIVNLIFENYMLYDGSIILFGAICFTIQLYMDFSGSMDAVCGIGEIFGIKMPENFKRPFFSKTISEFWTRWHISLGAFLRDYVFYPITMSKPLKKLTLKSRRKLGNHFGPLISGGISLFIVWWLNGLWHGSGWNFIFFGIYHFGLIFLGSLTSPLVKNFIEKNKIDNSSGLYKKIQITRTTILVIFGELFFNAQSLRAGLIMFSKIFTKFNFRSIMQIYSGELGIDMQDIGIISICLIIIYLIGLKQEEGVKIRETLLKQNIVIRWALIYALLLFIIIFGAYGHGYTPVDPMYANY